MPDSTKKSDGEAAQNGAHSSNRLVPTDFDDWLEEPPFIEDEMGCSDATALTMSPRPIFLLPDLLPRKSVGLVVSEPHVGKTLLLFDLAIAGATLRPFLGVVPTEKFKTLGLFMDSGGWQMRYLGDSLLAGRGIGWEDLYDMVPHKLRGASKRLDITKIEDTRKIIHTAWYYGVSVIIADSSSKFNSGDENDRVHMEMFMDHWSLIAHETNAAVLIADHTPVAGRDKKSVYQARGSSVKEADADIVWHLRKARERGVRELEVRKARGMVSEGVVYTFKYTRIDAPGVKDPVLIEVVSVGHREEKQVRRSQLENWIIAAMEEGGEVLVGDIVAYLVGSGKAESEHKGTEAARNALQRLRKMGVAKWVRKNTWALVGGADDQEGGGNGDGEG